MSTYEEILQLQEDYFKKTSKSGLMAAIMNDELAMSRYLIGEFKDLDFKDEDGRTFLHAAVEKENVELVKLMLDRDVDVNSVTTVGDTALHYATAKGNQDLVILLVENGAKVNEKNHKDATPLMEAILRNRPRILHTLLEFGADPNCGSYLNKSPLWAAIMLGLNEIVYLLAERGANVDQKLVLKEGYVELTLIEYSDMSKLRDDITSVLMANLIKRRSLGENICPENVTFMSIKLSQMDTSFKQEVFKMMSMKFRKDLTVYDFLTKDRYELSTYFSRKHLATSTEKYIEQIIDCFPYLKDALYFRINEIQYCSS